MLEVLGQVRTEDMLSRLTAKFPASDTRNINTYSSVNQLGLRGEDRPTLNEIWTVLPDSSIAILRADTVASVDVTLSYNGCVFIIRCAAARGAIFLLNANEANDYRMYINTSTHEPSGIWYRYEMTAVNTTSLSEVADNERNE